MKLEDFVCPSCDSRFQVKAKRGSYRFSVANSAYEPKMAAIRTGKVPNYVFLGYDPGAWRVTSGFVVPGHFIVPSVIQKRAPLSSTARRAGWVGSNILLGLLPPDARISLIDAGRPRAPAVVRNAWQRFAFLREKGPQERGWLGDVLRLVRQLGRREFHLTDIYAFEGELKALHPRNNNIVPKIRQQVQLLRDRGILNAQGKGHYAIVNPI
jgi:type II restriction enzyme